MTKSICKNTLSESINIYKNLPKFKYIVNPIVYLKIAEFLKKDKNGKK